MSATTPSTPLLSASTRPEPVATWSVLRVEIRDELLAIVREPAALFFSVLMPVGFFALFVGIFGGEGSTPGEVGTTMVATFGTFGVLSVTLMNPGIGLAADRETGWLRVKRVAAVPLPLTVASKVAAAVPYAVGVLAAMVATAAVMGRLEAAPGELVRLLLVLVVGSLAMVPFSLVVGAMTSSSTAAAVLNAVLLPMVVASGLWMPLEILPEVVGTIAHGLPPYHLAQLGLAQLHGGPWVGHALFLVATGGVGAVAAGVAYRRMRP